MAKIIAITNQKGGVGKTTTSINLSAALAEAGKKVLLLDFDPQGNATAGVGVDLETIEKTVLTAMNNQSSIDETIIKNVKKNLDVLPGDVELSSLESEFVNVANRERVLANTLDKIRDKYDFIIIDCPPAVGILTVNALVAADSCIVPVQCEYFSLEGLNQVLNVYSIVKGSMNTKLVIDGLLFTMYDSRTTLAKDVVKGVKETLKQPTFETMIPRNVRLAEAPSNGMTIFEYDNSSIGADRYRKLAKEILAKSEV